MISNPTIDQRMMIDPSAFIVVDGYSVPIYKPCVNPKLPADGIYAVVDTNAYVSILDVAQPLGNESFSKEGFSNVRDEFHKSQMEVLKEISQITFRENDCDEVLICRKLDDDTIQIDSFCHPIKCVGKHNARIVKKTIYRFTIILSTKNWPLESSAIKLEKKSENSEYTIEYIKVGDFNEINKEEKDEFKVLVDNADENARIFAREARTIQEMVKVVFERLLYISWAISYWSLEPKNGEKFTWVDAPAPEIPEGWFTR